MVDLTKTDEYLPAALEDCEGIEALLPSIEKVPRLICNLCEQMIEKLLKQMFQDNGVVPPRTHDLNDLISRAQELGWLPADVESVRAAGFLTGYGAKARYLTLGESGPDEAKAAVASANVLAKAINEAGYRAILIETDIHFLHEEDSRS